MKIKLHNSVLKQYQGENLFLLFDDKVFLVYTEDMIVLKYKIYNRYYFLVFSTKTKDFDKWKGFGTNDKYPDPYWWKNVKWKEMSKEDENQTS